MTVGTRTILVKTVVVLMIVNLSHYDPTSLTVAAASTADDCGWAGLTSTWEY